MKKPLHRDCWPGINATLSAQGKEPLVLKRAEAYLGVMVDDLVTKRHS